MYLLKATLNDLEWAASLESINTPYRIVRTFSKTMEPYREDLTEGEIEGPSRRPSWMTWL